MIWPTSAGTYTVPQHCSGHVILLLQEPLPSFCRSELALPKRTSYLTFSRSHLPLWASVFPLVKGEGIACGLWHPLIFRRELSIPLGRDSKWLFLLYTVRSLNPSMWVLRAVVCFCLDGFLCKIWILLGTINISSAFAGHCVSFCRAPHLLQGYFPTIIFWPRALWHTILLSLMGGSEGNMDISNADGLI